MPQPTHSEHGTNGLLPFQTVNQTLSTLHPSPAFDVDIKYFTPLQLQHPRIRPYDGNAILPRAITTSGGDFNYHPSGKRGFTAREFAALQGFPQEHVFVGKTRKDVMTQIGNAVPPVVAEALFKSIVRDLKRADGVE